MFLSPDVNTMHLPSGKNATDETDCSYPSKGGHSRSPVLASHIWMVVSSDADTMRLPSGKNAIHETHPSCPLRGSHRRSPISASHSQIVFVGIGQDSLMPAMPRRRHINIPTYLLILPLPLCSSLFVLITIEYFDIPQPFILDPHCRLL